jgi:hypothetical protein
VAQQPVLGVLSRALVAAGPEFHERERDDHQRELDEHEDDDSGDLVAVEDFR